MMDDELYEMLRWGDNPEGREELEILRQRVIELEKEVIDARNLGIEIGAAQYKEKRRKKLIEVGYYLCLRQLGQRGIQ